MSEKNDLHGKFNEMADAVLKPPPEVEKDKRGKDHAPKTRDQTGPARNTGRQRRRRVSR